MKNYNRDNTSKANTASLKSQTKKAEWDFCCKH